MRNKIQKLTQDNQNAKGLSSQEIQLAVKAGFIEPDQAYVWTEIWQRDLRAAERDVAAGRVSEPVNSAEELMIQLKALKAK